MFRATFTRLRIDLDREHMWEVDGEVIGRTRRLDITLHAEKLTLRTPVSRHAAEPPRDGTGSGSAQTLRQRASHSPYTPKMSTPTATISSRNSPNA